jgi:hypothetical protein
LDFIRELSAAIAIGAATFGLFRLCGWQRDGCPTGKFSTAWVSATQDHFVINENQRQSLCPQIVEKGFYRLVFCEGQRLSGQIKSLYLSPILQSPINVSRKADQCLIDINPADTTAAAQCGIKNLNYSIYRHLGYCLNLLVELQNYYSNCQLIRFRCS